MGEFGARNKFGDHRYTAAECKSVLGTLSGSTTSVAVWNAASTNKVRVTAYQLVAVVTVTLDKDEAAGNICGLWDNAATAPFIVLGVLATDDLAVGSSIPGWQGDQAMASIVATALPPYQAAVPIIELPRGGIVTAAAGNDILFGLSTGSAFVDIDGSAGRLVIVGRIWGTEAVEP